MSTKPQLVSALFLVFLCPAARTQEVRISSTSSATAPSSTSSRYSPLDVLPPTTKEKAKQLAERASVAVHPFLGPLGTTYVPPGYSDLGTIKAAEVAASDYYFPSIYFHMSLAPKLQPVIGSSTLTGKDVSSASVVDVRYEEYQAEWIEVEVEIEPKCPDLADEQLPCRAWLIWLLPDETLAGTRESLPVRIASTLDQLGGVVAPFFPSSSFDERVGASGGALGVLFRQLFPPKTINHQYAYISDAGPREPQATSGGPQFGWHLARDTSSEGAPRSILGLHHGIALLQVDKSVTAIDVTYESISRWNKEVNAADKPWFYTIPRTIELTMPKTRSPIEPVYGALTSLSKLPLAVRSEVVQKILHTDADGVKQLVEEKHLRGLADDKYITRGSLEAFLGEQKSRN